MPKLSLEEVQKHFFESHENNTIQWTIIDNLSKVFQALDMQLDPSPQQQIVRPNQLSENTNARKVYLALQNIVSIGDIVDELANGEEPEMIEMTRSNNKAAEETVVDGLGVIYNNLQDALKEKSPVEGMSLHDWLVEEGKKNNFDFDEAMKYLEEVTGLSWDLQPPQQEPPQQVENKVEAKVEEPKQEPPKQVEQKVEQPKQPWKPGDPPPYDPAAYYKEQVDSARADLQNDLAAEREGSFDEKQQETFKRHMFTYAALMDLKDSYENAVFEEGFEFTSEEEFKQNFKKEFDSIYNNYSDEQENPEYPAIAKKPVKELREIFGSADAKTNQFTLLPNEALVNNIIKTVDEIGKQQEPQQEQQEPQQEKDPGLEYLRSRQTLMVSALERDANRDTIDFERENRRYYRAHLSRLLAAREMEREKTYEGKKNEEIAKELDSRSKIIAEGADFLAVANMDMDTICQMISSYDKLDNKYKAIPADQIEENYKKVIVKAKEEQKEWEEANKNWKEKEEKKKQEEAKQKKEKEEKKKEEPKQEKKEEPKKAENPQQAGDKAPADESIEDIEKRYIDGLVNSVKALHEPNQTAEQQKNARKEFGKQLAGLFAVQQLATDKDLKNKSKGEIDKTIEQNSAEVAADPIFQLVVKDALPGSLKQVVCTDGANGKDYQPRSAEDIAGQYYGIAGTKISVYARDFYSNKRREYSKKLKENAETLRGEDISERQKKEARKAYQENLCALVALDGMIADTKEDTKISYVDWKNAEEDGKIAERASGLKDERNMQKLFEQCDDKKLIDMVFATENGELREKGTEAFLKEYGAVKEEQDKLDKIAAEEGRAMREIIAPRQNKENALPVPDEENVPEEVRNLRAQIETTKSTPLYSGIKSWFAGNSGEYETAIQKMKDFSDNKCDKQDAVNAVMEYLNIRRNKVRNTQFGRDRFDGMMKSLAVMMSPNAFVSYCKDVDDARFQRDKSYKGVTNPYHYLSEDRKAEYDRTRIAADAKNGDFENVKSEFLAGIQNANLKKMKPDELRTQLRKWSDFATEHPTARQEVQAALKAKGVKLTVPKPPEQAERQQEEPDRKSVRQMNL